MRKICRICNIFETKAKRKFKKIFCKTQKEEILEFYLCNFCNKSENIFILPALTEKEEPYIFVSINYGNF
jgi:hypothetical protein